MNEQEWEALAELARLEHDNTNNLQRLTYRKQLAKKLSPQKQEIVRLCINKDSVQDEAPSFEDGADIYWICI